MAFSSYLCHSLASLKVDHLGLTLRPKLNVRVEQRFSNSFKSNSSKLCGQRVATVEADLCRDWSFLGGTRATVRPKLAGCVLYKRGSGICASWMSTSHIANGVFTLGTAAVLPFYTLMVLAPKSELTKKSIESSVPYVALGLLYAYLLYLSWTPETIRLIFASKYWLPELPGIAKMFSSEMTLASAWIHLLVVDLFAARQVFHDGLENQIETRHSVSLCLLFCPIGIFTHVVTKALTKSSRSA